MVFVYCNTNDEVGSLKRIKKNEKTQTKFEDFEPCDISVTDESRPVQNLEMFQSLDKQVKNGQQ